MLEKLPEELRPHILGEYHVRKGKAPEWAGLELHSEHGMAVFIVTRQQLLDLAEDCRKAAESMQRPS